LKTGIQHKILDPGYRRYTLSIPENYPSEDPVPLIIALHYAGHGKLAYYGESILTNLIKPALDELGAIIAAPDCPSETWVTPTCDTLIHDLLEEINGSFNIHPGKVLVIGYSIGGIGAWHFASTFPHVFTAAIVMAGELPDNFHPKTNHVPTLVLHGRNDEVMPFLPTREAVESLQGQGWDIEYRLLEGVSHYQTHYFETPLRNTIPWLLDRWEKADASDVDIRF
jgi:predicted peptidase